MQVSLRPATGDDADTLTDLAHRAKAHWGYPANWMRAWDAQLTILPGYIEMHDVLRVQIVQRFDSHHCVT